MVGVYSHLSMRDVEDKDLVLHGLKTREEILKPIMQVRICPKCKAENAPVAVYCHKCGGILGGEQLQEVRKDLEEKNKLLEARLEKLEAISVERLTIKKE
jgi:ribosomal protein L40E